MGTGKLVGREDFHESGREDPVALSTQVQSVRHNAMIQNLLFRVPVPGFDQIAQALTGEAANGMVPATKPIP